MTNVVSSNRSGGGQTAIALVMGALLTTALAQSPTPQGTLVQGSSGQLFGQTVSTWARLAADGSVLSAGTTLPLALVQAAPPAPKGMAGMDHMADPPPGDKPFALDFPAEVQATTFLDHVDVGWAAAGHAPVYLQPHFNLHFFTLSRAAVEAIDCTDLTQSEPAGLPAGYAPPVPPNGNAADVCMPFMGFHAMPVVDLAPGAVFEKTMLAVYYHGKLSAIEPMVTQATLLKGESFTLPVPKFSGVGKATRFPTHFEAIFDKATQAYQLTFSDFVTVNPEMSRISCVSGGGYQFVPRTSQKCVSIA